MLYSEFEAKVIEAVKLKLGSESWFSGVSIDEDEIKSYFDLNDLTGAIEHAECETIYFDAPNCGFGQTKRRKT